MSDSRSVTLRKSDTILKEQIMFPLLFINPALGYSVESITRKIHSAPDIHLGNLHTFPQTILEFFWIKEGEAGKEPWVALGILEGDIYFLYTAYMSMPKDTFVKNGHMNLWVSTRYSDIISFAMDSSIYSLYLNNTKSVIHE